MNTHDLTQNLLYFAALIALAVPLGAWIARVWAGDLGFLGRLFGPVERALYRAAGVKPEAQMDWKQYAGSLLLFCLLCFLGVFLPLVFQGAWMPLNPDGRGALRWDSAFNDAVSFMTNTNWQGYAGESTMSHLVQMAALAVQNFLSAAVGMGVLAALSRGLSKKSLGEDGRGLGNFWVDITRTCLYVLLPLAFVFALVLVSQGVIQNFSGGVASHLAEGGTRALAQGPVASQEAIKMIGTNGGGFFNANSAHPYENPTPLTNFLETLAILLIPAAQCLAFGKQVLDRRQGVALLTTMTVVLATCLAVCTWSEYAHTHPALPALGVDTASGNLEGKEWRFGTGPSTLFATATTAASCGAVNSMHDSYAPLAGLIPLGLMQVGEVIFGGVGSGLYGMIHFVILTVFIAGLMVGRTPEYLGKKVGAHEMKCAIFALLIPNLSVLASTGIACLADAGIGGRNNPGAHGFTELFYACTSASNNNGSAFAGLAVDTPFWNVLLGLCMLAGRFGVIIPTLMMAGSLAKRSSAPPSAGTLPTHTWLFGALLIGIVVVMGALTFLPGLALGPIAEHVGVFVK